MVWALGAVSGAGGIGAVAALALMVPMEAGMLVPLPSDIVMLAVGVRVGAGDMPLWLAVVAFEGIALIGTAALFLVARGPGRAVVVRLGRRLGLNEARLDRASGVLERRGRPALAVGRATPGLRTLTVIAAGGTGLSPRRALPALVIGSSVFLQLHLFLGYFLGSSARHALRVATVPTMAALVALAVVAVAFWLMRRGRRQGSAGLTEAACPACLVLARVCEQPTELKSIVTTREAGIRTAR